MLDDPEWQLQPAVQRHLEHARKRAVIAARLAARLAAMAAELERQDHPSAEQLFATIEDMTMLDETVRGITGLLVYDDVAAAHEYVVRVYGLTPGPVTRDAQGRAVHGEVRAGDQVIWLHPAGGEYRSPRSLGGGQQHDCRRRR